MTVFPGPQAAAWWQALQTDRGSRARLRRSLSVMHAASEPATLTLCRRLGVGEAGLERAALLAAVLAHVHENRNKLSVARQIGAAGGLSELRFRQLLQADTPDEQILGFRRLVALAQRSLNVADLAVGIWHWNDDATRRHWICAYYDAPEFAAEAVSPDAEPSYSTKDASA